MPRSALGSTVVVALAELSAVFGSETGELALTAVVTVPPAAGAVAVTVIGDAAPTPRVPCVHVTTWPLALHDQPVPVAVPNPTPAPSVIVAVRELTVLPPAFSTSIAYTSAAPAVTGSGLSAMATEMSALAVTWVVVAAVLFVEVPSVVDAPTLAELAADPVVEGAVAVTVIDGAEPTARLAREHDAVVPAPLQFHPVPLALANAAPVGSVCVTLTFDAVLPPPLVTSMVYVIVPPASTGSGESASVIDRSALSVTVVITLALLLVDTGSLAADETDALFVIVPPVAGGDTSKVIVEDVPASSDVRVHVTVPELCVQVQPVPVALLYVAPAGSVSVTLTVPALLGPLFVTARA